MLRTLGVVSLLPLRLLASPASALTTAENAETCKFGAEDQKLTSAKRKTFLARCMANRNDKRGPATAAKKPAPKTKPAAAPGVAPPPDQKV